MYKDLLEPSCEWHYMPTLGGVSVNSGAVYFLKIYLACDSVPRPALLKTERYSARKRSLAYSSSLLVLGWVGVVKIRHARLSTNAGCMKCTMITVEPLPSDRSSLPCAQRMRVATTLLLCPSPSSSGTSHKSMVLIRPF